VPADAAPVLKQAARVIAALPAKSEILIVGHTDIVGTAQSNVALSLQRAEAVRAALIADGVAQEQLQVAGAGDSRPIAANASEQGRFANRRIEFGDGAR
jgi:outer membrane protein OmpA-like peptidoglycan-associated protein